MARRADKAMLKTIIVVPCYNEASRLDVEAFSDFVTQHDDIELLFVNDGSRDETARVLEQLRAQQPQRISIQHLPRNVGKAEAVRRGMLTAFARHPAFAGYWDADLATPLDEIPRFLKIMRRQKPVQLVMGTRVRLMGRQIERKVSRHFLGRIFATLASAILRLPVYDTQCGAKLFRISTPIVSLFQETFQSRWIFDVELLARCVARARDGFLPPPHEIIYECPLRHWCDVSGSKLKPWDFVQAFVELFQIHRKYSWNRRRKPETAVAQPAWFRLPATVTTSSMNDRKNRVPLALPVLPRPVLPRATVATTSMND